METLIRPQYRGQTAQRIINALRRARTRGHYAQYVGYSNNLSADCFSVKSSSLANVTYYLYAYRVPKGRGFVYLPTPVRYIVCQCSAAENGKPCDHGAKVAMKIARDYRQAASQAVRGYEQYRATVAYDGFIEPTGYEASGVCAHCGSETNTQLAACPVCGCFSTIEQEPVRGRERAVRLEDLFVA